MKIILIIMSVLNLVAFEGDSITAMDDVGNRLSYGFLAAGLTSSQVPGAGVFGSSSYNYFTFMNGNTVCLNRATGGLKLSDMSARASTWIDSLLSTPLNPPLSSWINTRPTRNNILCLMAGTNADTVDPNTHISNVLTYTNARRTAGWNKIIVCPIFSRTDGAWIGTPGSTTFDTTFVIPYDSSIVSNPSVVGADAVPRFDQITQLASAGAANSATYFADMVHPTAAGYALTPNVFQTALNSVLM